jgi:hypothetical protein
VLDPAEVRERGDATPEQRGELRALIKGQAVDDAWVQRFYLEVMRARGLSRTAASDALIYLRSLALKGEQPTHAIPAQAEALRGLIRSRIVPTPLATLFRTRYDAGVLAYIEADRMVRDWLRLPLRTYVVTGTTTIPADQVPDGYFTLRLADGTTRCYRIHSLPASGHRVVDQITGEKPHQRRRLHGYQALDVVRAVGDDPAAASRLYGETRHRCSACNIKLSDTTQPGYPHGFGRDCWEARQAVVPAGAAQ